jgi:hypothetical protein
MPERLTDPRYWKQTTQDIEGAFAAPPKPQGTPGAFIENVSRPTDRFQSEIAQQISPTMGAYGAGQMAGEVAKLAGEGEYGSAALAALPLAVGAVVPGPEGKPIRAYHWTDKPEMIGPNNKFAPFSHFGTPEAAQDRFLAPTGRFSVGELERQKAEPGSVVAGGTIPVDLHISNPLRVNDVGTHSPVNLAYSIERALDPDGDMLEVPDLVNNVLNAHVRNLSDEQIQQLGKDMELDWYYEEFGGPRTVERMRHWIADDIYRRVEEEASNPEEGSLLDALTIYGRDLDKYTSPEAAAAIQRLINRELEHGGHDGLVYQNHTEGGGADSYIATKEGTVRSPTTGEVLFGLGAGGAFALPRDEER